MTTTDWNLLNLSLIHILSKDFEILMKEAGCYFVNEEEKQMLQNYMFTLKDDGYDLRCV